MSRVITIVGASARAAASSARRAGFTVYSADLFADADLVRCGHAQRVVDYPRGLADIVAGSQPGGWMYTGALENHSALVGAMAETRRLWGNSAGCLKRVRDPQQLTNVFQTAGLRFPAIALTAEQLPRDGSWLRKLRHSAGGTHVARWDDQCVPQASERGAYYQQAIDGQPCSAVFVAAHGVAILLGVTRQLIGARWTGACGFRYCGSLGPLALSPAETEPWVRIGNVLAGEFNLEGLFGVDAVLNAQEVWCVEVNPRYTASVELLERCFGFHSIAQHAAACEHGKLRAMPTQAARHRHGKAILFAPRAFTVTREMHEALLCESHEPWPTLADIPATGTAIEAGWPIVTVFADAASESDVLHKLQTRCDELRGRLQLTGTS